MTGHIDGVGHLDQRIDDQDWSTFWFRVPAGLSRQMASKGSIAVDGVSLTLVDVENDRFSVALIPHTLKVTTLGPLQVGDPVNLETDVLAKYVEQQLRGGDTTLGATMTNRQTVSFLLQRFRDAGIRPDTRHGQNFLIDLNLVHRARGRGAARPPRCRAGSGHRAPGP